MLNFLEKKHKMFERWCLSKHVCSHFEKLKQIIVIEEFKICRKQWIRTYLDEEKVENLEQAATPADDYALSYTMLFTKQTNSNN